MLGRTMHCNIDKDFDEKFAELFIRSNEGECRKEVKESATIDGTRYDKGDYMIAVQWYDRLSEDDERRTFVEMTPVVSFFNSTELRLSGEGTLFFRRIFLAKSLRRSSLGFELELIAGEPRASLRGRRLPARTNAALKVSAC
jgi:hypothetical protein